MTLGSVYESLLDGGDGKFGSFPDVNVTGGSGLAGGTAWYWGDWNWGAWNGSWFEVSFCWLYLQLYKLMTPKNVELSENYLEITWDDAPHDQYQE